MEEKYLPCVEFWFWFCIEEGVLLSKLLESPSKVEARVSGQLKFPTLKPRARVLMCLTCLICFEEMEAESFAWRMGMGLRF